MDELAKRFAELADKYGPSVAEAAKSAARVEAYSTLVSGAVALVAAGILGYVCSLLVRKVLSEDWNEITWLPAGIIGVIAFICLIVGVWSLVDPWTWVAMSHPELWLAKKAFHI